MKKTFTLIIIIITIIPSLQAQYVNIPDLSFKNFLQYKYPSCFNTAGQLDTTCTDIVNEYLFDVNGDFIQTSAYGLQFFKELDQLIIRCPNIVQLDYLPPKISILDVDNCPNLLSISSFPDSINVLSITQNNSLTTLPKIPDAVSYAVIYNNSNLSSIPNFPLNDHFQFNCTYNNLTSIPRIKSGFTTIDCSHNQITQLPDSIYGTSFSCTNNQITKFPGHFILKQLDISNTQIASLPTNLRQLEHLNISNTNITCLPLLPTLLFEIIMDTSAIKCLPNKPINLTIYAGQEDSANIVSNYPVCNTQNNLQGCPILPVIKGKIFYDVNFNGIKDATENYSVNNVVEIDAYNYTYTNDSGYYEIRVPDTGTYSLNTYTPPYFTSIPVSKVYTFSSYDTVVHQNILLQPAAQKDSISIKVIPYTNRARPGLPFTYRIQYQNAGTTSLVAPQIVLHFDTLLVFVNASNSNVVVNGNTLSVQIANNLPVAYSGYIDIDFTVKTTAQLGNLLISNAAIYAGATNNTDTVYTFISNSYDPNCKEGPAIITPQQISNGDYIDYIIHFQNTGNDTAINIVITDTISAKLQLSTFEMLAASVADCKSTVNGNVISFEMKNVMLPDKNTNEKGSQGFIVFRIIPLRSLLAGDSIENKAAIYFDFNAPVITNNVVTHIRDKNIFPLKLLYFNAKKQNADKYILHWATANEINTKQFDIEKNITGNEFEKTGAVTAVGFGNNNYSYNIGLQSTSPIYYRLKITDIDGKYSYSPVLKLKSDYVDHSFTILQNPVYDRILLLNIHEHLHNTQAALINQNGIAVLKFTMNSPTQTIYVKQLPAGVYSLQTQKGNRQILIIK